MSMSPSPNRHAQPTQGATSKSINLLKGVISAKQKLKQPVTSIIKGKGNATIAASPKKVRM